jgi:hypothetical protein
MPTPASTIPPTEETRDVYRAAVLAYREAFAAERRRHGVMKADAGVPLWPARDAVMAMRSEMGSGEAECLAQQDCAPAAQAHNEWFWSTIPPHG